MAFTDINREDQFVEQPAIGLFAKPGWTTVPTLRIEIARYADLLADFT